MRKIVTVIETSGLDSQKWAGHRIVELAAIEINDSGITSNRIHRYFNPEREIEYGATEVHGLTTDKLRDEPRFAEFSHEIAEFIRDAELIAHNAPYDVCFLNSEFERAGMPSVGSICKKVTDTLYMAKKLYPEQKNNLNALCERYGIDFSQRNSRGAMLDAEILAEIYLKLSKDETKLGVASAGAVWGHA